MRRALATLTVSVACLSPVAAATASPSEATATVTTTATRYKNCTALNKVYAHGVGKKGARDRTSGSRPVTNFRVNTTVYRANTHLDRDKDGIACEKR